MKYLINVYSYYIEINTTDSLKFSNQTWFNSHTEFSDLVLFILNDFSLLNFLGIKNMILGYNNNILFNSNFGSIDIFLH